MIIKIKRDITEKYGKLNAVKIREDLLDMLIANENVLQKLYLELEKNIYTNFAKTKAIIEDLFLEELSDDTVKYIVKFCTCNKKTFAELKQVYIERCKKGIYSSWVMYIKAQE